ncbi:MAG: hypothetical protein JWO58_2975 [Chitinophagaceae bacterium]|nr:hypothetical protein [Chitinophagaceae bacterium]
MIIVNYNLRLVTCKNKMQQNKEEMPYSAAF